MENARRLALLLEGLRRGAPELIADGLADRLHVEHRLALVPGSRAPLAAATAAGAGGATISGSGSALLALCAPEDAEGVAAAMAQAWRDATGAGEGRALTLVPDAPEVRSARDS